MQLLKLYMIFKTIVDVRQIFKLNKKLLKALKPLKSELFEK